MRVRALVIASVLIFALISYLFESTVWASATHGTVPARNDWILKLSPANQAKWKCILWHESRSTLTSLNLMDNNRYGSSGIFQMMQGTFAAHQMAVHLPYRVHVWEASPVQQFAVARAVWLADGFQPWGGDGCF